MRVSFFVGKAGFEPAISRVQGEQGLQTPLLPESTRVSLVLNQTCLPGHLLEPGRLGS